MKKLLPLLCLVALAASFTSCNDDEQYTFSINGVDISNAKYIALAGQGSGKDESSQSYLYTIDEDGNMQIAAYEYQCDDEGVATELTRNLTVSVTQLVPVGSDYIWLLGCRYECDDYSGFSESMQDNIRGTVQHSRQSQFGDNFLLRKSDGKLFDLNEVVVRFPIGTLELLGMPEIPWVCIGGVPIDGDITGDRLRKLGLICEVGGDIYLASGTYYGNLFKLHDNGSTISVVEVLPGTQDYAVNIAYALTDGNGHLGTCISYGSNMPDVAAIMASDGTLPAIQGIPRDYQSTNQPEMRCIGGKFFVSVHGSEENDYTGGIYRVDINGGQATATAVANGYFSSDNYATTYICDDTCYTWASGTTLYTFNSETYELTESTLPDGWPEYSMFDAEGHYYEPVITQGLTRFTIYSLATLTTEDVVCDRTQVPTFNYYKSCSFDNGLMAFIESVIMADGSTATILTPVTGADRGVSRVGSQSAANNNMVVSTLIPIN